MTTMQRTRRCRRQRAEKPQGTPRGSKQICIPMTRDQYQTIWSDAQKVRQFLDELIADHPEIFPPGIEQGYQLTGHLPESKKLPGHQLRQLKLLSGGTFTLRPSFLFTYMTGTVDKLEHPLLLLSLGVPCWVVTAIFKHNDMFWQRLLEQLGRNSLVGTTVRDPARLPQHLAADEHHADWAGKKGYVTMTAGGNCILGVAITRAADEEHLTEGYGQFAEEARRVDPHYAPKTVNTDGWFATQNTVQALFAGVTTILCFLHGFLKIRDRSRKAHDLHQQIWDVYRAANAMEFSQKLTAFLDWFGERSWSKSVQAVVAKLKNHETEYLESYAHPGCHRTSNQVDRPMNRLARFLYAGRGLHGHLDSSELRLRGWALLNNFRPYAKRSGQPRAHQSPAHALSQRQYHRHWLHNLQVSASLRGYNRRT